MTAHRFPFSALRQRCGVTLAATARTLGITHNAASVHDRRGVTAAVADTLCRAAGMHPCEVWADWFDHADEPVGPYRGPRVHGPTVELPLTFEVEGCPTCGASVRFVAAGTPTDGGRRTIAALVCDHGHRQTLTVTLEAA